jgi:hypothetical protein
MHSHVRAAAQRVPTGCQLAGRLFPPCHGSRYDLAGLVFRGVPAPYNLPVPPYRFVSDTTIRIGENPPDVNFDFDSIQQIQPSDLERGELSRLAENSFCRATTVGIVETFSIHKRFKIATMRRKRLG